jgi:hypothetical protein
MLLLGRMLSAPAVHFVLLGGALFLLVGSRPPASPSRAEDAIVLTVADVERLRRAWADQHGTPPNAAEEARVVETALDEEVLHREALALGLDRDDPLVRERLVQLARLLDEGPVEDEEALEGSARALGLERTDVVVRRYLVQAVRLLAAGPRGTNLPTEAALTAYFDQHRDEFANPSRVRLTHVYLSADRRGAALDREAAALLHRFRRERIAPDVAPTLGDPFARGSDIALEAEAALDRTFGPGFAVAVAELPQASWNGPVRSAYGLHLVWVHERVPARVPALAEVRSRVVLRLLRERRDARVRAVTAALRKRYEIRVDGG